MKIWQSITTSEWNCVQIQVKRTKHRGKCVLANAVCTACAWRVEIKCNHNHNKIMLILYHVQITRAISAKMQNLEVLATAKWCFENKQCR